MYASSVSSVSFLDINSSRYLSFRRLCLVPTRSNKSALDGNTKVKPYSNDYIVWDGPTFKLVLCDLRLNQQSVRQCSDISSWMNVSNFCILIYMATILLCSPRMAVNASLPHSSIPLQWARTRATRDRFQFRDETDCNPVKQCNVAHLVFY